MVQAATGAPWALPGRLEDPRQGSRALDAVRRADGRGCPRQRRGTHLGDQAGEPRGRGAHRKSAGRIGPVTDDLCAGPGNPAQLGVAVDEYAQLRRYAKEAFASEVNIRVHRCTKLAYGTLDRPVFDLELERVPEEWQEVRRARSTPASSTARGRGRPAPPAGGTTSPWAQEPESSPWRGPGGGGGAAEA